MVFNLTGKNNNNNNSSLNGKCNTYNKYDNKGFKIPTEIQQFKIQIINSFLLPLYSKRWQYLKENFFLIESFKQKIYHLYNKYKSDDIILYFDMINLCEILIDNYVKLDLEEKSNMTKKVEQLSVSLVYKTAMIKLKPEYELYDSIRGKPQRYNNEDYDENIVTDIQKLMIMDNINFDLIKSFIDKKYPKPIPI
jgi:hypothetical protein